MEIVFFFLLSLSSLQQHFMACVLEHRLHIGKTHVEYHLYSPFSSRGKLQRFTAQTHQQGLCCLYHIRQKKVGPFQRVILYWFLETLRRWNSCFSWGLDWICYLQAEGWMVALRHQVKGGWGFVGYNLSDVFFLNHYEIMLLFFLSERGEGWRICEWLVMWVVGGCW